MSESKSKLLPCWVVIELMGHRKLAGYASETQVAGKGMRPVEVARRWREGAMKGASNA